jgi:hypothetical protein
MEDRLHNAMGLAAFRPLPFFATAEFGPKLAFAAPHLSGSKQRDHLLK